MTVAIRQIFQSVKAQGVEQYFVDCRYGDQEENVEWIPAGKLQTFLLMENHPLRLVQQLGAFMRWLKREQIQVVHVHHRRLTALLHPLQSIGGFRLVYTAHLSYPREAWFYLSCPTTAIAISPSVAANLKKTTRARHIEIIGNPSDFPSECPEVPVEAVSGTVLCVARFDPVKAHSYLIESWKKLIDRGITAKLLLVGEGELKQTVMDQVDTLGLHEFVEFRGFQRNVAMEIERCLFAVLTSAVEGSPVVIVEAASCGRPTLVTDVDGSRDAVPSNTLLPNRIPFGDSEKFCEALVAWIEQPAAVVQEGRAFYEFHKELHSPDVIGCLYTELYRRTLR